MHNVTIIGAGPAGLTAARTLVQAGIRDVQVLERNPQPGGLPRFCSHQGWGVWDMHRLYTGPRYAAELIGRAAGADIRINTTVTALEPDGHIHISTPDGAEHLQSHIVLLATGIRETPRGARLVSGTRPWGVTTTGAFQEMAQAGQIPFRRPVIIGSELVAFSALLTARHAGIKPMALIEPGPRILARRPGGLIARAIFGVPVRTKTQLLEIRGIDRVESVILERNGQREELSCDGVIFTGQFTPESWLPRSAGLEIDIATGGPAIDNFFRCADPAYFATGNLLRPVEHAGFAALEGARAAAQILRALRGELPPPQAAIPVTPGGALRYIYPQRIIPGSTPIQLYGRARHAHRGRLRAMADDTLIFERLINILPERRISLTLPGAALTGRKSLAVILD
jgi:NADPH-dependent 2,4-dienoyl-CoA reductase/sulfur reductase-like enzyme